MNNNFKKIDNITWEHTKTRFIIKETPLIALSKSYACSQLATVSTKDLLFPWQRVKIETF